MKTRLFGLSLVAGWLFTGLAWAAEPDSTQIKDEWRGQKVLAAKPGVLLREQPNDQAPTSPVSTAGIWLEVKRSEGAWLEVDWGWIRAADAVREDQAVEHFAAELARAETAFAHLARSRAWLEQNDFDKAQADVSEALRLEPNNARAYFARSKIAAKQKRTEEELSACDRALAIDPRDPFALNARSRLRSAAGEVDRAIGDIDRAIESLPRYSWLWSARGYYRELQGDYDQALANFSEAIRLDPHAAYSLSRRATIHFRRQELDKALQDAADAVQADPKLAKAYAIRGVIRSKKGALDAALADLDEAIRLDATDPVTFHNRGGVRYKKGEYDKAVLDLTQAISLKPDHAESYIGRADAWAKKGDAASAINDLTLYLRLRPMDANAYSNRGAALLVKADVDAAFKDFGAALEINPRHVGALLGRSRAWQLKNEPAKALDDVNAALDLAPNNPDAYVVRAWLRKDADPDAALKDLDAALAINPRRLDALLGRADVRHKKSEMHKAIADLTAAIEVDPKSTQAYWRRAELYSSQREHRRAIDDFTAVLRIKPGDIDCLMRRSSEWSSAGNVEQAVADCRAVLAKDSKKMMAYVLMAQAHFEAGQNEEALEDFAEAMRVDPHDEDIRFQRAYHLFLQDKLEQALADLDEVIQNGKRVADAYNWRGYLRMRRGQYDKALADLNEAIRLAPNDAGHYRMRADCWFAMKQFDNAIADADEALRLDPKSEEAARVRGQALEAKKDPAKADELQMAEDEVSDEEVLAGLRNTEHAASYRIELQGPEGLKLLFQTFGPKRFGPSFMSVPARVPMVEEGPMRFKLAGMPGLADRELYILLKSKRLHPQVIAMLRSATPAIRLTKSDLDEALAGKEVLKLLVVRRGEGDATAKPEFEVVAGAELDRKTDPIAAAARRGDVIAVLLVNKRPPPQIPLLLEDGLVAFCLRAPDGLMLTNRFSPHADGPTPAVMNCAMRRGDAIHFTVSRLAPASKSPAYALLTVSGQLPPETSLLAEGDLELAITNVELDAALAGKKVTRVVYLANSTEGGGAPRLLTLSSTEIDPDKDAVAEASKRGSILATLKLSNEPFEGADLQTVDVEVGEGTVFSGLTDEQRARCYEIELQGPEGVKAAVGDPIRNEFLPVLMDLPTRVPMLDNSAFRLKLTGIPGDAEAAIYALVKSKRLTAEEIETLRTANPTLTLIKADLDSALAGRDVRKVLVLRPQKGGRTEKPEFELLSSSDLDPKSDLVAGASRRGTTIAAILVSKSPPSLFSLSLGDEQFAMRVDGPEGLTLALDVSASGQFDGRACPLPARFDLAIGAGRRFKLNGSSAAAKDSIYGLLTLMPSLPPEILLVTETELSITLTQGELDAALAGKRVARVVYLIKGAKESDSPRLQTLSSADIQPGQDPLTKAFQRGAIVATVLLSRQLADLPSVAEPPAAEDEGGPYEPRASQICFLGLEGMRIQWDVTGPRKFDSEPLVVPGRFNFPKGAIYALKLSRIPGHEGAEIYPTLEVAPPLPRTEAYLEHNAIPIEFTAKDIDHVLEGKPLTKVVYLPGPDEESALQGGPATLVSSQLPSSLNPILEADRRGTILAIIRAGKDSSPAVEKPNASVTAEVGDDEH